MIVILICSISHRDWFNSEFYLTLNILLSHEADGEQIFYEKEIKTQMSQLFFLRDLHEKWLISYICWGRVYRHIQWPHPVARHDQGIM